MDRTLLQQVRSEIELNYNKGGWDVLVECWDDSEVADAIRGARTVKGAMRKLSPIVRHFASQQREAASYADGGGW